MAKKEKLPLDEFIAECEARRNAGLMVFGWPRERSSEIKAAGGFWDRVRKAWLIPEDALEILELEWKKTKGGKDYLVPLGHIPKRLREQEGDNA
jgi:hypothetical protein